MLRLGIVGLPNVGKSTLFNALTSSTAAAAENYPFCTVEPNVGVVLVPEPFALGGALHEAGDVHELDHRRHFRLGPDELEQPVEPRIRHRDHAHVRLDGAEGVVLGGRGL